MITFIPNEEVRLLTVDDYLSIEHDSDIKNIERVLDTSFSNIEAFKLLNDTEKTLATLLGICTDLKVVIGTDWHPLRLFGLLNDTLPDLDIQLLNYSITEDGMHYQISYSILGAQNTLVIETTDANTILDAVNRKLEDKQFIEVYPYQWVLFPNDVNIKGLSEAVFCVTRES